MARLDSVADESKNNIFIYFRVYLCHLALGDKVLVFY